MDINFGDIVRIVDEDDPYYNNTIGLVISHNKKLDLYLVVFTAVAPNGHEFVYDDAEFPRSVLSKVDSMLEEE